MFGHSERHFAVALPAMALSPKAIESIDGGNATDRLPTDFRP